MTVGIAAIAKNNGDPHTIVAADRMVTVGGGAGIEYESPGAKIETIVNNDDAAALAVGSGSSTLIDEIVDKILIEVSGNEPTTMRTVLSRTTTAYQKVIQETVENQALSPLGYELSDLKNGRSEIPREIQRVIAEQADAIRSDMADKVQFLISGVGQQGPGVFHVSGADFANLNDMGYGVVGSGTDSARLSFIRRGYDPSSDLREGLFSVLEAKSQAEERQGVGQQMDLAVVGAGEVDIFDEEDISDLRKKLGEIENAEREAREEVMHDWER